MFKTVKSHIFPALLLLAVLTVATGAVYPLLLTAAAQGAFPRRADGSLVSRDGKTIGSELIGQRFRNPGHFWGRPSATPGRPYNAAASSGSNLGPNNPALGEQVRARVAELRKWHGPGPVPAELVYASGSGLDPHISPAAAYYQALRVANASGLPVETVRKLVADRVEPRQFGLLGEPRVNVLALNLAVDLARRSTAPRTGHARF